MRVLLGVLKWVINCLQSYVSKMMKINPSSNNDQTIEFCQNSLLQRDFFIQYTLFTFYHTKLVSKPFSVGCFLELS